MVRPKMKKEQRECLGDVWSEGGDDTEHRGVLEGPMSDMVIRMSILSWTHSYVYMYVYIHVSYMYPLGIPIRGDP